jgi:hypothetical protein
MKRMALALITLALCSAAVAAPTLALHLMTVTAVTQNGVAHDVLIPGKNVRPGETLQQNATLRTDQLIRGGHITLPVAANTHYLPGSASVVTGLTLEFSADNGKTFSAEPMKTVTVTENGKSVQKIVPVPENEYSTVRWTVATLKAGGEINVSYRATVN